MPDPISLKVLADGVLGKIGGPHHALCRRHTPGAIRVMGLRAPGVNRITRIRPLDQVAVAVNAKTIAGTGQSVSLIRRAMEYLPVADIFVERPVRRRNELIVSPVVSPRGSPVRVSGIELPVVTSVHYKSITDLLLIAEALGQQRFGFGPSQSGQQQRRQDSDDRDHHQQFDQGKTRAASLPGGPSSASIMSPHTFLSQKPQKHRYERRKIREYLHLGDWQSADAACPTIISAIETRGPLHDLEVNTGNLSACSARLSMVFMVPKLSVSDLVISTGPAPH